MTAMLLRRLTRPAILGLGLLFAAYVSPRPAAARPDVWIYPPPMGGGAQLRELFNDAAGWKQTRSRIAGIGYADHWLSTQFSDAELRAWLPQLARWGMGLSLEVGALKPWGTTGASAFDHDRRFWDRFIAAGGHIDAIAMDEPFAASRRFLHQPFAYAVQQTAEFVALVRHAYPAVRIGDIEPTPYFQHGEIAAFIDALQASLRQMGVRGLDFFRADVDWMHFHPGDPIGQDGWRGVRAIEEECHARGLAFSLIYWAANFPSLQRAGEASDETWNAAITGQLKAYRAAGGRPDEFVIESWLNTPAHALPETAPDSFTGSVLDFTDRLATQ